MAGTPYWRERKLVTSSSLTNPSDTSVDPRRVFAPFSLCARIALSSCSDVMIFSLTRRSPSLCDISPRFVPDGTKNYSLRFPLMGWGDSPVERKHVSSASLSLVTQIVNSQFTLEPYVLPV